MKPSINDLRNWVADTIQGRRNLTLVLVGGESFQRHSFATAIALWVNKSLLMCQSDLHFQSYVCAKIAYSDSPILTSEYLNGDSGSPYLYVVNIDEFSEIGLPNSENTDEEALSNWKGILKRMLA